VKREYLWLGFIRLCPQGVSRHSVTAVIIFCPEAYILLVCFKEIENIVLNNDILIYIKTRLSIFLNIYLMNFYKRFGMNDGYKKR